MTTTLWHGPALSKRQCFPPGERMREGGRQKGERREGEREGGREGGRERDDTHFLPFSSLFLHLFCPYIQVGLDPLAVFLFAGTTGLLGRSLRAPGRRRGRDTRRKTRTSTKPRKRKRWPRKTNCDHRDDHQHGNMGNWGRREGRKEEFLDITTLTLRPSPLHL